MKLPIYVYGEPVLRKKAEDIAPDYPDLKKLISDMFETLSDAEGVGLAAPQIGLSIRLVVIDLSSLADEDPKYAGFKKAYINGHILEKSEETCSMAEGCLSIPGLHENVVRAQKVKINYVDDNFEKKEEWVDGFLARVIQHEFGHLEGQMYTDLISPLRKQLISRKLKSIAHGKYGCNYRTKFNRHL